jgi:hypothetical protein
VDREYRIINTLGKRRRGNEEKRRRRKEAERRREEEEKKRCHTFAHVPTNYNTRITPLLLPSSFSLLLSQAMPVLTFLAPLRFVRTTVSLAPPSTSWTL